MKTKPKILIVDDKPENLVALRTILKNLDIQLVEATSGNDALKKTLHHDFALALLDIQMPGMDGYELAKILREAEKTAHLPFIFISAVYTDNADVFKGYEKGAFSFITKPFQPEILINKVKFFIDKHQQEIALFELNKELKNKNKELSILNDEKEKRATELVVADKELALQNEEKETRAAELIIADKDLEFLNEEKEKRAAELIVAYKELAFQNEEKEKRAAELVIANRELVVQNKEKEKRAAELIIANRELVFQNKEKEKQAAALRIANKELVELRNSEKFAVIGRLASTLAHEIRNPLTNISLAATQLSSGTTLNKAQEENMYQIINRNCALINKLLSDLLHSTSTVQLNFEPVNLNKVLDETLEMALDRIQLKKIKLVKNYSTDVCKIKTDIEKIKIAFLNLIINAIEAMESVTGILTISTGVKNGKCSVLISDNGKGMTKSELSRLFEPFYTTKKDGTGLGLTNTHNIILGHDANIFAESEPGKGTFFTVTLPTISDR
jgi:signal transduction histidine kinase/CheY-like chemotaxis protein